MTIAIPSLSRVFSCTALLLSLLVCCAYSQTPDATTKFRLAQSLEQAGETERAVAVARSLADNERKVIGFMGTVTHDSDFMMILQPLRELLRKHRDRIEFQIIGGVGDATFLAAGTGDEDFAPVASTRFP